MSQLNLARVRYSGDEPIIVVLVTDASYRFAPGEDWRDLPREDAELLADFDVFDVDLSEGTKSTGST